MAARRAAARAAAAAAAEPPPPPAEPTPEPEPEAKEPETAHGSAVEEAPTMQEQQAIQKEGKVTERIIERIIICPGGQNPYMPAPPPPPPCPPPRPCCCPAQGGKKKSKKGKKKLDEEGLCNHKYCIVQRARMKPEGLPWASGLFPGSPPPPAKPPVVICQRPVLYCCAGRTEDSDSDSEDEDEDAPRTDTETYMTFMNMVFAASNVMNERRDAF